MLSLEPNPRALPERGRARTVRIKAPFLLTRMRDWRGRGRRCACLWSRRDKEWIIEQELYLGRTQQPVPSTLEGPLIPADLLEQCDSAASEVMVDSA